MKAKQTQFAQARKKLLDTAIRLRLPFAAMSVRGAEREPTVGVPTAPADSAVAPEPPPTSGNGSDCSHPEKKLRPAPRRSAKPSRPRGLRGKHPDPNSKAQRTGRGLHPTIRQQVFAEKIADPRSPTFGNATRSALETYRTTNLNTAHNIGSENLRKPTVRREIERVLEESGATLKKVARRLNEGMDGEFTRMFCTRRGKIILAPPQPDLQERRLAAVEVAKLHGAYPTGQEQERRALLQFQQNILIVPSTDQAAPDHDPVELVPVAREVEE